MNTVTDFITALQSILEEKSTLEATLDRVCRERDDQESRCGNLREELFALRRETSGLENRIRDLTITNTHFNERHLQLQEALDSAQRELFQAKEWGALEHKTNGEVSAALATARAQRDSLEHELTEARRANADLIKEMHACAADMADLRGKYDSTLHELFETRDAHTALEHRLAEAKDAHTIALDSITDLRGALKNAWDRVAELEAEGKETKALISTYSPDAIDLSQRLLEAEARYSALNRTLGEANASATSAQALYEAAAGKQVDLENALAEANRQLEGAGAANDTLTEEVIHLKEELEAKGKELDDIFAEHESLTQALQLASREFRTSYQNLSRSPARTLLAALEDFCDSLE